MMRLFVVEKKIFMHENAREKTRRRLDAADCQRHFIAIAIELSAVTIG